MKTAPITLFAYKRLSHLTQTVESLRKNDLAPESDLIVFSDGYKSDLDKPEVEAVRKFAKGISGFRSVKVIESPENRGLARSIVEGVTQVVNEHGRIIVLEDDIVTSPHFLSYMNAALDAYEGTPEVKHASGYFFAGGEKLPDAFFCNLMFCWGWATWARAWKDFSGDVDRHISYLEKLPDRGQKLYIDNALSILKANKAGTMRTWAAFWQASILEAGGYCLNPHLSYTKNVGMDGSGEHSNETDPFHTETASSLVLAPAGLPLTENLDAVKLCNATLKRARGSLAYRLARRLKRLVIR